MTAVAPSVSRGWVPLMTADDADDFPRDRKRAAFDKLNRRVVVLCMGIFFLSYVDRCNVGYAASDLCSDLKITHSEYGTAVSLFYVGYILVQPLSNVCLRKFGAPTWLAFIVCAWGCVATASAFIQSLWQFYIIRILLGIAEGGSFPGVFYYLGLFFPDAYIEEPYIIVCSMVAFSMPISSPLAAGLLGSDGLYGTRGWRNLFFVEGILPVLFSIFLFFFLPRSLEESKFLDPEERDWLITQQRGRKDSINADLLTESLEVVKSLRFWLLTNAWGLGAGVFVTLLYWATLIIQEGLHGRKEEDKDTCSSGGNSVLAVVLTAIPYALHGTSCISLRKVSHLIRNRTRFTAYNLSVVAVILCSWAWTKEISFIFGFLTLTLALTVWSAGLVFVMGVISTMFRSELRATALALANGLGNVGTLVMPIVAGRFVQSYGYKYAVPFGAVMLLMAALSAFMVRDPMLGSRGRGDGGEEHSDWNHASI